MATQAPATLALPTPPALHVETVSDEPVFVALETIWNWLWRESAAQPFLRHEWVRAAWDCFGAGRRLRVLVVRAGAEPVAIAPLMLGRVRLYGVGVRRLEFIGNVHTPRFEMMVARWPREALAAIWQRLAAEAGRWDVLQLRDLPEGSPTLRELEAAARASGFLTGRWASCEAPNVPVSGTWSGYLAGLKTKHRSNLRNRFKRLSLVGAVHREEVRCAEPEAVARALELEASGWKGARATAILAQPATAAFYRRIVEWAAQQGWLRLHFLRVGGRRIAFQLTLEHERRIYVLKLGHDPGFAPLSPQNLLCSLVLEDAFARGLERYEFLGDAEPWKLEWARERLAHHWLFVFPNTLRGRLLWRAKFDALPRLRRLPLYRFLRERLQREPEPGR